VDLHPGDPFTSFGHTWNRSFTYNPSQFLGLTGEFGGYNFQRNVGGNQIRALSPHCCLDAAEFAEVRSLCAVAEFLFGAANAGVEMTGTDSQSTFAMASGGGVDWFSTRTWRGGLRRLIT